MRSDEQSVTNSGKLFHARGPATAKARSPSNERRVAGTMRQDDDADRSLGLVMALGNMVIISVLGRHG